MKSTDDNKIYGEVVLTVKHYVKIPRSKALSLDDIRHYWDDVLEEHEMERSLTGIEYPKE